MIENIASRPLGRSALRGGKLCPSLANSSLAGRLARSDLEPVPHAKILFIVMSSHVSTARTSGPGFSVLGSGLIICMIWWEGVLGVGVEGRSMSAG